YQGELATGWIRVFFPYLVVGDGRFARSEALAGGGVAPSRFPSGLSCVPVRVQEENGELREMVNVLGGFVGVSEDPQTKALRPELGWAVQRDRAGTAIERAARTARTGTTPPATLRSRLAKA